jgi:hypothetical protein
MSRDDGPRQRLELSDSLTLLLEECRMVLPGIQALFGFQLIAVFSQGFGQQLAPWQQKLHLASTLLVAVSIALVMAPASIHRRAERGYATERFLRVGSRLLLAAMMPLALGICLELFLVAAVVLHEVAVAAGLALLVLATFIALWIVYPSRFRRTRQANDEDRTSRPPAAPLQ